MPETGGILKGKCQLWHFRVGRRRRWHSKDSPFKIRVEPNAHQVAIFVWWRKNIRRKEQALNYKQISEQLCTLGMNRLNRDG